MDAVTNYCREKLETLFMFSRQTMYIILSWCYGQICHQHWPPGQLYAGRDEDRTLRGLTPYERRLSVSKATNAQPAGYSLSLTWRAPCLQKKHGGLSVVCSASLCIIAGRFYPWSLFSYGRNRKEVLYWRNTGWNHGHWWVFYHAFNSRSKLFRLHIF